MIIILINEKAQRTGSNPYNQESNLVNFDVSEKRSIMSGLKKVFVTFDSDKVHFVFVAYGVETVL